MRNTTSKKMKKAEKNKRDKNTYEFKEIAKLKKLSVHLGKQKEKGEKKKQNKRAAHTPTSYSHRFELQALAANKVSCGSVGEEERLTPRQLVRYRTRLRRSSFWCHSLPITAS